MDPRNTPGYRTHRALSNLSSIDVDQLETADIAVTLIREYAHALLHFDIDDEAERAKREVEAEAVAYIVGRYFDLNTSRSAFYLAAWQGDEPNAVQDRLGRSVERPRRSSRLSRTESAHSY